MYEMYAQPQTSFGDVTRHFSEQGILVNGKSLFKTNLSKILRNPIYAQADMDIYDFFKNNGTEIDGDASDFTGVTGCCLFRKKECSDQSRYGLQDRVLVPSPHEGIVSSELWLKVRKKLMANPKYQTARKPTQTWLAGKAKCGRCGYALMSVRNTVKVRYFRCTKRLDTKSCEGCGAIRADEFEQLIYNTMVEKLRCFKSISAHGGTPSNPKLTAAKVELAQVDAEIEKLVDSLTGANAILLSFANRKAEELESRRQALTLHIASLSTNEIPTVKLTEISRYLDDWDNTDFDDKRQVVDSIINVIRATSENVEIEWKI